MSGRQIDLEDAIKTAELEKITKTPPRTQRESVLRVLLEDGTITSMEAFSEFGITRLAGIIHSLRRVDRLDIETIDVTTKNRFGHPVVYARYKLTKQ